MSKCQRDQSTRDLVGEREYNSTMMPVLRGVFIMPRPPFRSYPYNSQSDPENMYSQCTEYRDLASTDIQKNREPGSRQLTPSPKCTFLTSHFTRPQLNPLLTLLFFYPNNSADRVLSRLNNPPSVHSLSLPFSRRPSLYWVT